MNTTIRTRRAWGALAAGAVVGMLALTACSAASTAASAPEPSSTAAPGNGGGNGARPGVSGLIAAAQDGQLQVQASDSQTTVRYTADTTVRTTVTEAVSAVQVGQCVFAMAGDDEVVTRITVTDAVDGTCTSGFPGGGGGTPPAGGSGNAGRGMPSGMPTDRPTDMPSGAPSGGFGGTVTAGAVTAVAADSITVDATGQDGKTTSTILTVDADTTVSTTVAGSASDIAEGLCVTAQGTADSSGGYDATSLTLTKPNDSGQCAGGRGGFGGGPNGNGQGGNGASGDGGTNNG